MMNYMWRQSVRLLAALGVIVMGFGASAVSAETLLMPTRDFKTGAAEIVWGVTTQANGTSFTLDYGDGSAPTVGVVADRSYIAFAHTYALSGVFDVTLTVGAEQATVKVNVYNAALLSPFDARGLEVNRTIQDGLRSLYVNQTNRAGNFPAGLMTDWGGGFTYQISAASLVVQAFQNHGYLVPNNQATPAGIYERFVVLRGLNFIANTVNQISMGVQTAGTPCVGPGVEAAPCVGLVSNDNSDPGYATALAALAFAGSNASSRILTPGVPGTGNAGFVVGKTYAQILQRLINAVTFGQNDVGTGKGGWTYSFNSSVSDGSTVGWDVLALLDAGAAGAVIPAFVKTEFAGTAYVNAINTTAGAYAGSFDYNADANPAADNVLGHSTARAGIGIQSAFYVGKPANDPYVTQAKTYITNRWAVNSDNYYCFGNNRHNLGCGYAMFNIFKGLKLFGVQTLPGINRPAGPAPIPADDWYAAYVDYLVGSQTNSGLPTTDGNWTDAAMTFSCCGSNNAMANALAELILAPVALIQPDPTKFSTVGLSPQSATNPVGTSHTVTAKAESSGGAGVPGATVNFKVISGPNVNKTGSGITDATGSVSFTYQDTAGPGTDQIQANIGNLFSNIVTKTWTVDAPLKCDVDNDKDVDAADLAAIYAANRQVASGPNDPRDANGDKRITVADYRYCQLRLTAQPQ